MIKKKTKVSLVLGILFFIFIVSSAGCTRKVMWVGNNIPGHMQASYQVFSGKDTRKINAKPGEVIVLQYNSEVEKGELFITLTNKKGEVIQDIPVNKEGIIEVPVADKGKYKVRIEGKNTSGSFDLKWEVE